MTDKIIEAATACGIWVPMGDDKQKDVAALARFYAIAYRAGLEDASLCAAIHCQYPVETDFDRGYGKGSRDASDRIRALMKETP